MNYNININNYNYNYKYKNLNKSIEMDILVPKYLISNKHDSI